MQLPALTVGLLAAAIAAAGWGAAPALHAQTTPAAPPSQPALRCDTPDHRRFDFWVGDWDVTTEGQPDRKSVV